MEKRFHLRLKVEPHCCLSDPVFDGRYTQVSLPPITLGNRNLQHRRRKVSSRRHAVPDPVEVLLQVSLEVLHGLAIHPGCPTIGFDATVRVPNQLLGYIKRLCLVHELLPSLVDPKTRLNNAAP